MTTQGICSVDPATTCVKEADICRHYESADPELPARVLVTEIGLADTTVRILRRLHIRTLADILDTPRHTIIAGNHLDRPAITDIIRTLRDMRLTW